MIPRDALILPAGGENDEPEAKINLFQKITLLKEARKYLGEINKTTIFPEMINMGGHAQINIICEAVTNKSFIPFTEAGKFFRLAARVGESGEFYDIKLAIKCLSSHVQHIHGVPAREEFEKRLPRKVNLKEGIQQFLDQYHEHYQTDVFADVSLENIVPLAAYAGARTGLIATKNLKDMKLVSEVCEDIFIPIGPDLLTPLWDNGTPEVQFEWENIGYLFYGDKNALPSITKRRSISLQSMEHTRDALLKRLWPQHPEWQQEACITDSKSEISIKRAMRHDCFMPAFQRCGCGFNIHAAAHDACLRFIVSNGRPLHDLLSDNDVIKTITGFARDLERQRKDYNKYVPESLKVDPSRILAA